MDRSFYDSRLKSALLAGESELYMVRVGNSCSDGFVKLVRPETCKDETRLQIKHDPKFRQYQAENAVKRRPIVDFNTHQSRKKVKLHSTPPEMKLISKRLGKIRKNQKESIHSAYHQFKSVSNSCFTTEAIA